jgi:hypothetical protein
MARQMDNLKREYRPRLLVTAIACAFIAVASPASAWEINFEDSFLDLTPSVVGGEFQGRIIDDEFATPGRISTTDPSLTAIFTGYSGGASGNTTPPVLFDTNNPTGGDTDLGAPFTNVATGEVLLPGYILILHEKPNKCRNSSGAQVQFSTGTAVSCDDPDDIGARPAGRFEIEFNKPITLQTIDFFDVETAESGPGPNNEIVLYDVDGSQILDNGPFYTPDTGGDNKWSQVVFNTIGVKKIELRMAGSGGIDNITGDIGAIPEPGTSAAFLAGLMVLGVARRRRRAGYTPPV